VRISKASIDFLRSFLIRIIRKFLILISLFLPKMKDRFVTDAS